jgi:hypothetical protein
VVFLVSETTTVAAHYFSCDLSLKKDELSWLSIGSSATSTIILSRKYNGAWGSLHAYGWVTIVILSMVK